MGGGWSESEGLWSTRLNSTWCGLSMVGRVADRQANGYDGSAVPAWSSGPISFSGEGLVRIKPHIPFLHLLLVLLVSYKKFHRPHS